VQRVMVLFVKSVHLIVVTELCSSLDSWPLEF
jgi:hypothetical protein